MEIRRVGTSLGVILPKAVLARMKVGDGDELVLTDVPGGVRLTAHDPTLEEQIERGRAPLSPDGKAARPPRARRR